MISLITIIYVLLGTQVPILYVLFPDFLFFGVVFGVGYFLVANALGRFDIKHGPLAVEQTLSFLNNPPFQSLVDTVERLEEKVDSLIEELVKNDGLRDSYKK
jgi:hypothetical protein